MLRLRVLSWNLGSGNARWEDLAAVLAGWDWDVAMLRGLPGRWSLPVATALDAEFRYAPAGPQGSRLRRMLSWGPTVLSGPSVGDVNAILARRDRIVSEWPADPRRAVRSGIHVARLACGVWVGNVKDGGLSPHLAADLQATVSDEALAVTGPRTGPAADGEATDAPLIEVAHGGDDGIWASPELVPVSDPELLAGGAVRGNPPIAVTLEHRTSPQGGSPGAPQSDSAAR